MTEAFICDAIRTPFGRYGGALAACAPTTWRALPIKALMSRNPAVDWAAVDDVIYGCANQAGEDNRNVARMARCSRACPVECRARPSTACAARASMRSRARRA